MSTRFENQIIWLIRNIKDNKTKHFYMEKFENICKGENKEDKELGMIALIKALEVYEK